MVTKLEDLDKSVLKANESNDNGAEDEKWVGKKRKMRVAWPVGQEPLPSGPTDDCDYMCSICYSA